MTADSYADVSGLVERSAASYTASVPEHPADDGFFGPRSVTWRLTTDLSGPIGGLRSLMVQALHPLAMAGVDQHSTWRQDPVGRLAATQSYVTTVSVGDRATAERVSAVVRRVHTHVRGTDPVTGQPYAADDPALLLWVHAALVDSTVVAVRMFGAGLSDADADRYVAEMVAAAELVGIPRDLVPSRSGRLKVNCVGRAHRVRDLHPCLGRRGAAGQAELVDAAIGVALHANDLVELDRRDWVCAVRKV